jgi:hypothetical protein
LESIRTFKGTPGGLVDRWRSNKAQRATMTPDEQRIAAETYAAKIVELAANDQI